MNTQNKEIALICIPYAGGTKYSYNGFKPYLSEKIELITLELPGRGQKMMDPLLGNIEEMADELYRQISPHLGQNYILFGHSMGGTLGNHLLHKIQAVGGKMPLSFIITGCAAPSFKKKDKLLHIMDDEAFIQELSALGGFPEDILASEDLMEIFLPILRADITALETYKYQDLGRYNVALDVIAGTEEGIDKNQLDAWEKETTKALTIKRVKGNHFFILDYFSELAKLIHSKLPASIYKEW